MVRFSRSVLLMVFFFLAVFAVRAYGGDAASLIQQGDRAFNREDYGSALKFYEQAAAQAAGQPAVLAEIINNAAAVFMATGNLQAFQRYFNQARDMKQRLARPASRPSRGPTLLINGGFEDGIVFPWGTGHYEKMDGKFNYGLWWNSMNANAFMKIDAAESYSGRNSLRITSYSPSKPHVFTTISQRVTGLKPNTLYKLSCRIKGRDVPSGAALLTVDAAWVKRFALPPGTYDWKPFVVSVNIGHSDYIDFRIVYQNTGTLWLDDIAVEAADAPEAADIWQQAEGLYDAARYAEALKLYARLDQQYAGNEGTLRYVKWYTGRVQLLMGNYDQAFANLSFAVNKGIGRAQIDLGELYYRLGDFPAAVRYYDKALEVVKGDQGTTSLVLHKLSETQLAWGKREEAIRTEERAYTILKHIDDKHGQALSLNHLGVISRQKKDEKRARTYFQQAYELAVRLEDRKLQSDIGLNVADMAYRGGQYKECRTFLQDALPIKEAIGDQAGLIQVLGLQGRVDVAENRLLDARTAYQRAVFILESISAVVGGISKETKSTFMQQFSQIQREYVDLLLRLYQQTGRPEFYREAFTEAEQARSRMFTEMMTEARAVQSLIATTADRIFTELLEKERLTNLEIAALETQVRQMKNQEGKDALLKRLDQLRDDRKAIQAQITRHYPRYADLKTPGRLHIEDVQKELEPAEAALSYFVSPRQTALWVISREQAVCILIPLPRKDLIGKSEAFRRSFGRILESLERPDAAGGQTLRAAFQFPTDQAHDLYRILVAPSEKIIRAKKTVYVAPDDLLYKLPFEALLTGPFVPGPAERTVPGMSLQEAPFWVKTQSLAYLPSLSVLRSLRAYGKETVEEQEPLAAFADPDFSIKGKEAGGSTAPGTSATRSALMRAVSIKPKGTQWLLPPLPDTREEALSVAAMLGASPKWDVFLREKASEVVVKGLDLNRYRHLLFATHGLMAGDFGPGTQPALALSFVGDPGNDGLLEMGEILGLNLSADLVVLSACNTAAGNAEEDRGEGFAGLTRSFMYAGARSLLVTQWSVESRSAKMLVQKTFGRLIKKSPKGEALGLAKRDMIASGETIPIGPSLRVSTAHPFFWAPYVLVGEAK